MKLRNVILSAIALVPLSSGLSRCAVAQYQNSPELNVKAAVSADPRPGVIVEIVAKESAAEKAGVQTGDILVGWTRGDASGKIDSPFDIPLYRNRPIAARDCDPRTGQFAGLLGCSFSQYPRFLVFQFVRSSRTGGV